MSTWAWVAVGIGAYIAIVVLVLAVLIAAGRADEHALRWWYRR